MNFKTILFALSILLFAACTKDDDSITDPGNPIGGAEAIDLSDIKAGQSSIYLHFNASCDLISSQWTGDTLIVEVIENSEGLFLHEYFTEGSSTMSDNPSQIHEIIDRDEYVLLPNRSLSNLFFFYGNDTLWKDPTVEVELSKAGCFLEYPNGDPFIGDEIGHIQHADFGVTSRSDLKVVSCVPFFELDAYLIYDLNRLEVSYWIEPGLTGESTIRGWAQEF